MTAVIGAMCRLIAFFYARRDGDQALKGKEFRLAELGNDAGMYGAVRMVLS